MSLYTQYRVQSMTPPPQNTNKKHNMNKTCAWYKLPPFPHVSLSFPVQFYKVAPWKMARWSWPHSPEPWSWSLLIKDSANLSAVRKVCPAAHLPDSGTGVKTWTSILGMGAWEHWCCLKILKKTRGVQGNICRKPCFFNIFEGDCPKQGETQDAASLQFYWEDDDNHGIWRCCVLYFQTRPEGIPANLPFN